jgi:hypothetical protein
MPSAFKSSISILYSHQSLIADDHFDFNREMNNFTVSVKKYCSRGYSDFRFPREAGLSEGYRRIPVGRGIRSERKKHFLIR